MCLATPCPWFAFEGDSRQLILLPGPESWILCRSRGRMSGWLLLTLLPLFVIIIIEIGANPEGEYKVDSIAKYLVTNCVSCF